MAGDRGVPRWIFVL